MSLSSSVGMSTKSEALEPTNEKVNDPEILEDDASPEFVKNSKAVSTWTIAASALANFSDGYQNNLVRPIGSVYASQ